MTYLKHHMEMLRTVAQALGSDICEQMTFVGGCTTGLLLTDEFTREQVRYTDDVDVIVHVMGYADYARLQNQLRQRGFKDSDPTMGDGEPVCAMRLESLRVDFMPDDEAVLGFSNRWYKDAMKSATPYHLSETLTINLVDPVYFLATKLEAYKGRGEGDALSSRDIEDFLHLVDGRPELLEEVRAADTGVQQYIADESGRLLSDSNFEYVVVSQAGGSTDREALLFERLEALSTLMDPRR